MSVSVALVRIPLGVVVARSKALHPWDEYDWQPVAVLPGLPDAKPWTPLQEEGDRTTFYAGAAELELYRTETTNYLGNLTSGAPSVWVALRPTGGKPPYELVAVTADPAEGESYTAAGDDLVEMLPMPDAVRDIIEAFVAEHHVERVFHHKRKRDVADPEALARRGPMQGQRRK